MHNIIQGSDEWHKARLGKVTASRIKDVMAGGNGISKQRYMAELITETLTGSPINSFKSDAMEWGNEQEPHAVSMYQFMNDIEVQEIGFVDHPEIPMSGASPDRLVGEEGLLEIKCPDSHTHIYNMLTSKVKSEYIKQIQWQLDCTGRIWCDFISFDPRLPPKQQLHVVRVNRDLEMILKIREAVEAFQEEMKTKLEKLEAA